VQDLSFEIIEHRPRAIRHRHLLEKHRWEGIVSANWDLFDGPNRASKYPTAFAAATPRSESRAWDGLEKRHGLCRLDFNTQRRMPKLSASFYREIIERNTMV
jgi:hypothetical protein